MEQNKRNTSANSTTVFIRVIAAGFVFYSLWEIISAFLKGGEDAPSLTLLLLAIAVLGGGAVGILEADWLAVASVSAMAGVVCILTALAGLPEVASE